MFLNMLSIWIFVGIFAGIEGKICQNITRYNGCGERLKNNITSVTNTYALVFEAVDYICRNGTDTVTCFMEGLEVCPDSNITFKSEFAKQQWNVSIISTLLNSGCQSAGAEAFMSNYGCMQTEIYSHGYNVCMDLAVSANPLGGNNSISCGLQRDGSRCITTFVGKGSCTNQTALDFLLKWYYIKGNFQNGCGGVGSGVESLMMTDTCALVGSIYIFLRLLP